MRCATLVVSLALKNRTDPTTGAKKEWLHLLGGVQDSEDIGIDELGLVTPNMDLPIISHDHFVRYPFKVPYFHLRNLHQFTPVKSRHTRPYLCGYILQIVACLQFKIGLKAPRSLRYSRSARQ